MNAFSPPINWFGEWLASPVRCRGIRLVIEQMSEAAPRAGVANLRVETNPPAINSQREETGFRFDEPVEVVSLRHENLSDTAWVRQARVEAQLAAGAEWRTVVPSRLIDARHRQPCIWPNTVQTLESSRLPVGRGSSWVNSFYHDYLLRTVEPCGPGSKYPDWLEPRYILAAAAPPAGFCYVYNPGDSGCFDALIAAIHQPRLAIESQKLFPQLISRFGFMPAVLNPGKDDRALVLDYSGTIWGPSCFWDLWSWTRDREFLGWFTPALAQWSRWWLANRDRNGDGWLEPGVNACQKAAPEREKALRDHLAPHGWPEEGFQYVAIQNPDGSALGMSFNECPWDDYPVYVRGRYRGVRFDPKTCSVSIHFIETQLYNAGLADFCARAFDELGDHAQATEFRRQARRLEALVRDHCWNEQTGFYYDNDVGTGRLRTESMHAGGFYPMIHGIPTMEQARRMVAHLLDPEKFWTAYPVPTLARDSADYHPTHYWSGRAWPPVNFHILRGLIRYGFFEAADQLLVRWAEHTAGCIERSREGRRLLDYTDASLRNFDMRHIHIPNCEMIVAENWNPETGAVIGSPGLTWGGLWIPAIIYRNFWPDGAHHALVRPGGHLRFRQKDRWDVTVDGDRAEINGHKIHLVQATTYRLDCRTGQAEPLPLNSNIP